MLLSVLYQKKNFVILTLFLSFIFFSSLQIKAQENTFQQYQGIVKDNVSHNPLVFAVIRIIDTNISTITNTEGEFKLKVPENYYHKEIEITMLGYERFTISLEEFKNNSTLFLNTSIVKLSEIVLTLPKDAKHLVKTMFNKTGKNNTDKHLLMTAFYRESIKKRNKNVSLAEAIVQIYKQPYKSSLSDKIQLYKARKSTDYTRLDTIALKLEGGPFNALFVDMMKYPEHIFTSETINLYNFTFSPTTMINDKSVYVVDFKHQNALARPTFYGKLYIDVQSQALVSAIYSLDVSNKEKAAKIFVKKKPKGVFVYPTSVSYRVDYRENEGKWSYGYSNAQLTFKIKKKGKWFKSTYSINSEMLVSDWEENISKEKLKYKERMRYSIIISDEASGFSDPEYWGAYNIIEPDKSIESAIKKIKKKLIE